MKAIIDGIRYDTKRSNLIGKSQLLGEELYYGIKNGNFFLIIPSSTYGESKYINTTKLKKQMINSNSGAGFYVIPISRKEAFDWLFENKQSNAIDEYFSDLIISSKGMFKKLCIADLPDLAEKYFPDLIEDA